MGNKLELGIISLCWVFKQIQHNLFTLIGYIKVRFLCRVLFINLKKSNLMTTKEIREKLCFYDERNPDNTIELMGLDEYDLKKLRENCTCDNCFSGRTRLAEFILKLQAGQCLHLEQFDHEHEPTH